MNSLADLKVWAKNKAKEHLIHRNEIFSFVSLCEDEIEEGGSETHEVQLAYNDICDLLGIDE